VGAGAGAGVAPSSGDGVRMMIPSGVRRDRAVFKVRNPGMRRWSTETVTLWLSFDGC